MKSDVEQIVQTAWSVAMSLVLACGCGTAFAHGGGSAGAGNGAAGGGFGGHGGTAGHVGGHVGAAKASAHIAINGWDGHISHHVPPGCCGTGAGVVSPIWDPYFWFDDRTANPAGNAYAERATLPELGANALPPTWSLYYCADSGAYYPYVRECASTWRQVAPRPSS
jgi:hypothetical protein